MSYTPPVGNATNSKKGVLQLSGDLGGDATTPTVPALASKEPKITPGAANQYMRGDKTWQTLDKVAIGLDKVDNTADSTKTFSAAQITSGVLSADRLGTGARTGTNFLRDDGQWVPASGGVTGTTVISTGPYTLDPKRCPDGNIVAVPSGTVIMTHRGNRFSNSTNGTAVTEDLTNASGTLPLSMIDTATSAVTFDGSGIFGKSIKLTIANDATTSPRLFASVTPGQTEVHFSVLFRIPNALPNAVTDVVQVWGSSGSLVRLIVTGNAGTSGVNLDIDLAPVAGREAIGLVAPLGSMLRFAAACKVGATPGTSCLKAALYTVTPANGAEALVPGSDVEITTANLPINSTITNMQWGRANPSNVWLGQAMYLDAVRIAHGAGAYTNTLLKSEVLYPEAL